MLPLVRARLLQSVAITATGLGLLDLARGPQEEALQLRRDQLGDGHKDTLASIESSMNRAIDSVAQKSLLVITEKDQW